MRKQRKHLERQQERHRERRALQEQSNEAELQASKEQASKAASKACTGTLQPALAQVSRTNLSLYQEGLERNLPQYLQV
jgi:hypothetical protein